MRGFVPFICFIKIKIIRTTPPIHKQVIPMIETLFMGTTMNTQFRINGVITVFLVIIGLTGGVTGASLTQSWQEHPADDATFSNPLISADGSIVFAGGNQLLVRSWNGDTRWGGLSGNVATMSSDGNYFVSALSDMSVHSTGPVM